MTKDEALKLALEALNEWGKGFPDLVGDLDKQAISAIKEALAQPPVAKPHEQEPVAWQKIECPICGDMAIATDILTPQRKPLTDEQLLKVIKTIDRDEQFIQQALRHLARAIEAAHNIKE